MYRVLACLALAACAAPSELVAALGRGDLAASRALVDRGADPDATDADGTSALMLAARRGDAALVRAMLARGADPKHANRAGATALHEAVADLETVRALVDAGAPVDTADEGGLTPLVLAASRDDGGPVVELLVARGADAKRVRGGLGAGDPRSLRALLAHGADVHETTLVAAAREGNVDNLRAMLAAGAQVDARRGPIGATALMWAAQMGYPDAVAVLLASGADVNQTETFNGTTALMQAAASDRAPPELVAALLDANADPQIADDEGATALDWALRRGDPDIVQLIAAREHAPRPPRLYSSSGPRAGDANTPAAAIARAVPLLEHSRAVFRKKSGCPSCHHDSLPAMALAAAQARGVAIDESARRAAVRATIDGLRPRRARYLLGYGFADIVEPAYLLAGLAAGGYRPDDVTASLARYLELGQAADGRWPAAMQRIPMDGSDVSFTAVAIRALAGYASAPDRIARGRAYLAKVAATTTEDRAYQLLGLHWAGAPPRELGELASALAATQRSDGGFAQRAALRSDAYATGQAIVALREAAALPASDPVIQRAARFLLVQQLRDGSWFVATRALRFQPFFDSEFRHGRSQYMSIAATAWAVMALALTGDSALDVRGR